MTGEELGAELLRTADDEERRRAAGLSTLAENTERIRAEDELLSDEA